MFRYLRTAIAIALAFSFLSSQAQFENHTWYFSGTNVGMSFDLVTNAMTVTNVHVPLDIQGTSVASDPVTGQLLFYGNGINVYDAGHQQMPNGSGLNSHASCTQKGPVGFVPGQCNRYYIFTNSANDLAAGNISYSVVDMSLPGNGTSSNPKGDVIASSKNTYITNQACEAITLVPGTHNNNYWLLVPRINSDSIRVFSITAAGIAFSGSYSSGYYLSNPRSIRYSKAAGKIAMTSMIEAEPAYVMSFNPATGVLSNAAVVTGTPLLSNTNQFHGFVDAEFSADGTKLYLSKYRDSSPVSAGKLYQYDLNNPSAPLTLIYAIPSTSWVHWGGGLKLGPDGKIYWLKVNENNTSRYIGVVNSPNTAGSGCNFNPNGVDVLIDMGATTKFPACLFYQNSPPVALVDTVSVSVPCGQQSDTIFIYPLANDSDADGDQLSVSILSAGMGSATILPNNIIRYITPSAYTGSDVLSYIVCDDQCRALCDTAQVVVNISIQSPAPQNFLGNDLTLCSGQSVTVSATLQGQYTWSTGATGSSIIVSNPGTYWVDFSSSTCTTRDTIIITGAPVPQAAITGPSVICANSNATLNATGGGTYAWSTGATSASITVNPPVTTTYSVVVTNSTGCTDTAYYTINVNPPPFVNAGADVTICAGDSVQLNGTFSGSTFYWTPNANISNIYAVSPWVYPAATTTYVMVGMSQNDCSGKDSVTVTVSSCTGILEMTASQGIMLAPNPADGYFEIYLENPVNDAVIELYDVQGALVLSKTDNLGIRSRIEVPDLAKGLYLVRISAGKIVKSAQIIIE